MDMNVSNSTSAYKSSAQAYDGYEVDKDAIARIKEEAAQANKNKSSQPSKEFLEQQAAIFERPEVKEFLSNYGVNHYQNVDRLGDNLMNDYRKQSGYYNNNKLDSMNSSEKTDYYQKAYAEIYDEIEKGYADGTRETKIVDKDGNKRLATKEEELAALDKKYEEITNSLTYQRGKEVDRELVAQGKKEAQQQVMDSKYEAMNAAYKAQQPQATVSEEVKEFVKSVTFENNDELEAKKLDFVNMLSQKMMDFSTLFKQSFNQAQPGTFDMAAFLANVSQK